MDPKKEFESFAAAYILGEKKSFKIKGNKKQINAVKEALNNSRKLLEILENDSADSAELNEVLESKNKSAQEFKNVFGFEWPF